MSNLLLYHCRGDEIVKRAFVIVLLIFVLVFGHALPSEAAFCGTKWLVKTETFCLDGKTHIIKYWAQTCHYDNGEYYTEYWEEEVKNGCRDTSSNKLFSHLYQIENL